MVMLKPCDRHCYSIFKALLSSNKYTIAVLVVSDLTNGMRTMLGVRFSPKTKYNMWYVIS